MVALFSSSFWEQRRVPASNCVDRDRINPSLAVSRSTSPCDPPTQRGCFPRPFRRGPRCRERCWSWGGPDESFPTPSWLGKGLPRNSRRRLVRRTVLLGRLQTLRNRAQNEGSTLTCLGIEGAVSCQLYELWCRERSRCVPHGAILVDPVAPFLDVLPAGEESVTGLLELAAQQGVEPYLQVLVLWFIDEIVELLGIGLVVVEQPRAVKRANVRIALRAHAAVLAASMGTSPFAERGRTGDQGRAFRICASASYPSHCFFVESSSS